MPDRAMRYSGSERPACRMYQTGVYGTGLRLQASRKGESPSAGVTSGIVSQAGTAAGRKPAGDGQPPDP